MEWLRHTPLCVVEAHLEMMERIQANELMNAANAAGVGQSSKRGRWAGRQMNKWRRVASSGRGASRTAGPADFQAAGIGYRTVKVKRGN